MRGENTEEGWIQEPLRRKWASSSETGGKVASSWRWRPRDTAWWKGRWALLLLAQPIRKLRAASVSVTRLSDSWGQCYGLEKYPPSTGPPMSTAWSQNGVVGNWYHLCKVGLGGRSWDHGGHTSERGCDTLWYFVPFLSVCCLLGHEVCVCS